MDFIFTPILWLLPLTTLPLIFHLINNKKFKSIDFGAMKFITSLKNESIKKVNLINILLLILRMLIILCLILTISRPVVSSSNSTVIKNSSTNVIFLIDDTYSNFNQKIYGKQYAKILDIIKKISKEYSPDSIVEISTATKDLVYKGSMKNLNLETLNISNTFLNSNITDLMNIYFNADQGSSINQDMYILSDMSKESFKNIDSNENWNVAFIDTQEPYPDPLIKNIEVKDLFIVPSNPFSINVDIVNNNKDFQSNINAYVELDGMELSKKININSQEVYQIEFNAILTYPGKYNAIARIEYLDGSIIDKRFLKINVLESTSICLYDLKENEMNKYLKTSISAIMPNNKNLIKIDRCDLSSMLLYDIVIIDDFSYLEENSIKDFADNGGHLILFPDFEKNKNKALVQEQHIIRKKDILDQKLHEDIFGNMKDSRLFNIKKTFILPFDNSSIIEFSNKGSIWNRTLKGSGLIDIFGFNLDLDASTLPLKGAFLPFVYYLIGESNKTKKSNFLLTNKDLNIFNTKINKAKTKASSSVLYKGLEGETSNIDRPGFYSAYTKNDTIITFSVNIDTNEIASDKIKYEDLKKEFNNNYIISNDIQDILEQFKKRSKGYEVWHIILSIAAILLILELTIINRFEHRI